MATKTQQVEKGVPSKLDKNTFTKTGYEFLGWNTDKTSEDILYKDEQNNVTFYENKTLYAIWKYVPVVNDYIRGYLPESEKLEDPSSITEEKLLQFGSKTKEEFLQQYTTPSGTSQQFFCIQEDAYGLNTLIVKHIESSSNVELQGPIEKIISTKKYLMYYSNLSTPTTTANNYKTELKSIDLENALKFTATQSSSTIKLMASSGVNEIDLRYSTDGINWNAYTIDDMITLGNIYDYVYIVAGRDGNSTINTSNGYYHFVMTGGISASGTIQSLLNSVEPTTIAPEYCYRNIFENCTSLVTAPHLTATTLNNKCYYKMFSGCTSLNSIKVEFTEWKTIYSTLVTEDWLQSVSTNGTFYCPSTLDDTTRDNSHIPSGWDVVNADLLKPLTFKCTKDNVTISINKSNSISSPTPTLIYSKNNDEWKDFIIDDTIINLSKDDILKIKADIGGNERFANSTDTYDYFKIDGDGEVSLSGNIMTLLNADNPTKIISQQYCFIGLFKDCEKITDISELKLPATTLTRGCYMTTFQNIGITSIPENLLPAISLSEDCYRYMFCACKKLIEISDNLLPATQLKSFCYCGMFSMCPKLTSIPQNLLPATEMMNYCYYNMFNGCTILNCIYTHQYTFMIENNATLDWLNNASDTGEFHCSKKLDTTTRGTSTCPDNWYVINDMDNKVTFNTNGGSTIEDQYVWNGNKVIKPTDPTKSGESFVGWYKESQLINLFDFDDIINTNTTLYAKWE